MEGGGGRGGREGVSKMGNMFSLCPSNNYCVVYYY